MPGYPDPRYPQTMADLLPEEAERQGIVPSSPVPQTLGDLFQSPAQSLPPLDREESRREMSPLVERYRKARQEGMTPQAAAQQAASAADTAPAQPTPVAPDVTTPSVAPAASTNDAPMFRRKVAGGIMETDVAPGEPLTSENNEESRFIPVEQSPAVPGLPPLSGAVSGTPASEVPGLPGNKTVSSTMGPPPGIQGGPPGGSTQPMSALDRYMKLIQGARSQDEAQANENRRIMLIQQFLANLNPRMSGPDPSLLPPTNRADQMMDEYGMVARREDEERDRMMRQAQFDERQGETRRGNDLRAEILQEQLGMRDREVRLRENEREAETAAAEERDRALRAEMSAITAANPRLARVYTPEQIAGMDADRIDRVLTQLNPGRTLRGSGGGGRGVGAGNRDVYVQNFMNTWRSQNPNATPEQIQQAEALARQAVADADRDFLGETAVRNVQTPSQQQAARELAANTPMSVGQIERGTENLSRALAKTSNWREVVQRANDALSSGGYANWEVAVALGSRESAVGRVINQARIEDLQRIISRLNSIDLNQLSGAAINEHEAVRLNESIAATRTSDPQVFRNAVRDLMADLETFDTHVISGFHPDIQEQFRRNRDYALSQRGGGQVGGQIRIRRRGDTGRGRVATPEQAEAILRDPRFERVP